MRRLLAVPEVVQVYVKVPVFPLIVESTVSAVGYTELCASRSVE